MCSEEKPVAEPLVIEKAKCFYDEIKMTSAHVLMASSD
jgi:hypothetical protein